MTEELTAFALKHQIDFDWLSGGNLRGLHRMPGKSGLPARAVKPKPDPAVMADPLRTIIAGEVANAAGLKFVGFQAVLEPLLWPDAFEIRARTSFWFQTKNAHSDWSMSQEAKSL